MRLITLIAAFAAVSLSLTAAPATLKFDAPAGWVSKTPSSSMRMAEYTLAKVAGDAEDATVTVFFFGATQGGNVQANIDRWISQMAQPDGRPSAERAQTAKGATASGLKMTTVDVSGTFVAEVAPGSAEHFNKPGFRQIAVYVDTPGGPYFVKALGPVKTLAKWDASVATFLKNIRFE